jgi:hypothetical protein
MCNRKIPKFFENNFIVGMMDKVRKRPDSGWPTRGPVFHLAGRVHFSPNLAV